MRATLLTSLASVYREKLDARLVLRDLPNGPPGAALELPAAQVDVRCDKVSRFPAASLKYACCLCIDMTVACALI
jgi:hypothetical protein